MAKKKQPRAIVSGVLAAAKRFFSSSAAYHPACYLGEPKRRVGMAPELGMGYGGAIAYNKDGVPYVIDIETGAPA